MIARKMPAGVDAYFLQQVSLALHSPRSTAKYETELREAETQGGHISCLGDRPPGMWPRSWARRGGKKIGARRRAQRYLELCDKRPTQLLNSYPGAKEWSQGRFGQAV